MRNNDLGCEGWIVISIILFFIWKWHDGSGPWTGWIYPEASDLSRSLHLGEYKTFEQCQQPRLTGCCRCARMTGIMSAADVASSIRLTG